MNKRDIKSIAYLLKQAKTNNRPKPIVFLGAGASISAGIPLTGKIIQDILEKHGEKPEILALSADDRSNYYKVMAALDTPERHELLRGYIESPDVKINATHIYLAQMLKEGYIDYVVTVNFDDLILKACSLFNFIPAVYDIAILKDFTTTTLQKRSVIYLHGQYHGLWLLNTPEELGKIKEPERDSVTNIFRQICNDRSWIILGYSGDDGILDKMANLGRFDNNLYWVGYKDHEPSSNVKEKLLDKPNSSAYWVSGYDSDSFFLKLHSELRIDTPEIFNKPFSFLTGIINNIKDFDASEELGKDLQELFKQVKERSATSRKWIEDAISRYENPQVQTKLLKKEEIDLDDIKQEIIEAALKQDFDKVGELSRKSKSYGSALDENMANLYFNLGYELDQKGDYPSALKLYEKSAALEPNAHAYHNMGAIYAKQRVSDKAKQFLNKSIELKPDLFQAYNNLGTVYHDEKKFDTAIGLLEKAISINPEYSIAHYNLGNSYYELNGCEKAIACYLHSLDLNPELGVAYWGLYNSYGKLGDKDKSHEYALKYAEATPKDPTAHANLGFSYFKIGNPAKAEELFAKSLTLGENEYAYMNIGHIDLCRQHETDALLNYKKGMSICKDKTAYWKGLEEDYQYLSQYGITRDYYQGILDRLKQG